MWRGLFQIFLDIDGVVAEGGFGLAARGRQRGRQFGRLAHHFHAAPAAAGRRLDQHRIADPVRQSCRLRVSEVTPPSEPGTTGMPSRLAVRLASILSPMMRMCSALGPMKCHAVVGEDFGKARVLRQEAVAGMHGVGAGDLAGRQNGGDVEIAVFGRRRADAHALVGKAHVHGVGVGGGMHRHGRDAELLAGAQHAQRDLAAIGDEDFIEHQSHPCPSC